MRALIVEDEAALREQLRAQLAGQGFAVDAVGDGDEGSYQGQEFDYDVAVVDLGLPKLSGLDMIRQWRAAGRTFPVLILTARGRWQEKVEGLEAGADDYVVKPFQMEELVARLRALVRRTGGWTQSLLRCGPVELDMNTQQVRVDDTGVELTAYEYKVLEYLMLRAGEVVSKTELTDHIYEQDYDRDSNVLEVFVARLRRKLDPAARLNPIETLRGRGYRFAIPRESAQ